MSGWTLDQPAQAGFVATGPSGAVLTARLPYGATVTPLALRDALEPPIAREAYPLPAPLDLVARQRRQRRVNRRE